MPKLILLIQFSVTSLVLIAISVPLIFGWVAPNRWYGFRTRRTLADPSIWYPINALAGKRLAGAALTILVGAGAFYFVPRWQLLHYAIANLAVAVFALGYAILQSALDLKKFPSEKNVQEDDEDEDQEDEEKQPDTVQEVTNEAKPLDDEAPT